MRSRTERSSEVQRFPPARRFVTGAVRRTMVMHALVSVDVTGVLPKLKASSLSLTAFVVAAVARAVAAHPEVHAYRDWRGRLVACHFVDVATLIEAQTPHGPFPLAHLVRDADVRSVSEISAEIRTVASDPSTSGSGRALQWAGRLPVPSVLVRLAYLLTFRSRQLRKITGTVTVSAVGMFGQGGGFGISIPTTASVSVVVGGMGRRPWGGGEGTIEARQVLDLTISADHTIVDGAPFARFVSELQALLKGTDSRLDLVGT